MKATPRVKTIVLEKKEGIATITINRPKVLNALSRETLEEFKGVIGDVETDDDVKAVVITGAGERAFSVGADINDFAKLKNPMEALGLIKLGQRVFCDIENLEKPVIAAVNGLALGGGCELAMACDIRIASENARFGQPEVNVGIIPGHGGTQRLPRLVGKGKAKELIFTGEIIDAKEAKRIGLVNKVAPADKLRTAVIDMAKKIVSKAPIAVKLAKSVINRGTETDLETALELEADAASLCFSTADAKEGREAFLEKRKPQFRGK